MSENVAFKKIGCCIDQSCQQSSCDLNLLQQRPGEGRGGDTAAQPLAVALEGQQTAPGRHPQHQEAAGAVSAVSAEAGGTR